MKDKSNNTGMNTPKGYFENFEDRMMLRVMEENLPESNGLRVPNTYFDSLEERVVDRLAVNKEPKVIPLFSKRTLIYVSGIAASLILLISLWGKTDELSLDELSANEVEEYIENGGIDLSSYEVMALLAEDELSEISISSEVISDEALEAYLLENFDETSLIE